MLNLTDNSFEKEINTGGMVVVDCYADWCAPCKTIAPIMDELDTEYTYIKFYKLNVDENYQTSNKYNIRSIPTILIFKNGELVETMVGSSPKSRYTDMIDKLK